MTGMTSPSSPRHQWSNIGPKNIEYSLYNNCSYTYVCNPVTNASGQVNFLAYSSTNESILYAASNHFGNGIGIFRSADGGKTWTSIASGLPSTAVMGIAVSKDDPNLVVAALMSGMWRSSNGGGKWQQTLSASVTETTDNDLYQVQDGTLFAVTDAGLWQSSDFGSTWSSVGLPSLGHSYLTSGTFLDNGSKIWLGVIDWHTWDGYVLSKTSAQTWTESSVFFALPAGRPGYVWPARVEQVEANPADTSVVWAIVWTNYDHGSLYLSGDSGRTFSAVDQTSLGIAFATSGTVYPVLPAQYITYDSVNANRILVGVDEGIFSSSDGGKSFSPMVNSSHWISLDTRLIRVDQLQDSRIYIAGDQGLFLSTDGGKRWEGLVDGLSVNMIYGMTKVGSSILAVAQDFGEIYSCDDGNNWATVPTPECANKVGANAISEWGIFGLDPFNETNLLALSSGEGSTTGSLAVSNDGGRSFRATNINKNWAGNPYEPSATPIAFAPSSHGKTVYLGGTSGVIVSTDWGAQWALERGSPSNVAAVAVSYQNSNTVYAANSAGLYKSIDGGTTWSLVNGGSYRSLAIDPADDSTMVALSMGANGVFTSRDGGTHFTKDGITAPFFESASVYRVGGEPVVVVASWDKIEASFDYGNSWTDYTANLPPSPSITSFFLGDDGDGYVTTYGSGIWVYPDIFSSSRATAEVTLGYSIHGGGLNKAPYVSYTLNGIPRVSRLGDQPTSFYADIGTSWNVTSDFGVSSSVERWQSTQAAQGTVKGIASVYLNYYHQYLVSPSYGVAGGGGSPGQSEFSYASFGNSSSVSFAYTLAPVWADAGSSWSLSSILSGSTSTERWAASNTHGTVDFPGTISATYVHQFFLAVTGHGLNSKWYDAGTEASVVTAGVYDRGNGVGSRTTSYVIDGGPAALVNPTTGPVIVTITMNESHSLTFQSVEQYEVTLDEGTTQALSSITKPTISGDSYWYDAGAPVSLVLDGVWGRTSGSGSRLAAYSVNGNSTQTSTTGAVKALSIGSISSPQSVSVRISTQHQLSTPTGSIASVTSPSIAGDSGWYDNGTAITVNYNDIWNTVVQESRLLATGYTIDGGHLVEVPESANGTFTARLFMGSAHSIDVKYVSQFFTSFSFTNADGSKVVTPADLQISVYGQNQDVPQFNVWLNNGTTFSISRVAFEGVDVKPASPSQYLVTGPSKIAARTDVYDGAVKVTDFLGLPVSGASVMMTLANGSVISGTTGGDGTLVAPSIPLGTFTAKVSMLGSSVQVAGDASKQYVTPVSVLFGTESLGLVIGVAVTILGMAAVMLKRRSRRRSRALTSVRMTSGAVSKSLQLVS